MEEEKEDLNDEFISPEEGSDDPKTLWVRMTRWIKNYGC